MSVDIRIFFTHSNVSDTKTHLEFEVEAKRILSCSFLALRSHSATLDMDLIKSSKKHHQHIWTYTHINEHTWPLTAKGSMHAITLVTVIALLLQ